MTSLMVNAEEHTHPANQNDFLQGEAKSIRKLLRSSTASIISIGGKLREVKDRLKHGEFTSWVVNDCGIMMRSAQNYMRVSEFAEHKSETISHLTPASIYRLAARATPSEVTVRVLELLQQGTVPSEADIDKMIKLACNASPEVLDACQFNLDRAQWASQLALQLRAKVSDATAR
jgi:hypothetical protein